MKVFVQIRHGIVAPAVISGRGIALFLKMKAELQEPIKIYKAVTPAPKPSPLKAPTKEMDSSTSHNHDHSHEHPQEAVPHAHAEKPNTSSGKYDWREDNLFDATLPESDPWGQSSPIDESTDAAEDTYPPHDWHKTEVSELCAEYFRSQLITQFGNRPEVHILADTTLKIRQNMPLTQEEYIADLEAQYALFPDERTLQVLEKAKSESRHRFIIFSEDSE